MKMTVKEFIEMFDNVGDDNYISFVTSNGVQVVVAVQKCLTTDLYPPADETKTDIIVYIGRKNEED